MMILKNNETTVLQHKTIRIIKLGKENNANLELFRMEC